MITILAEAQHLKLSSFSSVLAHAISLGNRHLRFASSNFFYYSLKDFSRLIRLPRTSNSTTPSALAASYPPRPKFCHFSQLPSAFSSFISSRPVRIVPEKLPDCPPPYTRPLSTSSTSSTNSGHQLTSCHLRIAQSRLRICHCHHIVLLLHLKLSLAQNTQLMRSFVADCQASSCPTSARYVLTRRHPTNIPPYTA